MKEEIGFYLEHPEVFQTLLNDGSSGDPSTLPQLRDLFAAVPELSAHVGDISKLAEKQLVTQLAGTNLVKQEAITHALAALETSLRDGVHGTTVILIRQVRNAMLMLSLANSPPTGLSSAHGNSRR